MSFQSILITGGAGFVGSSLALSWKRNFAGNVFVVDSLKRRGSELNLFRLQAAGVPFLHADVRCPEDLSGLPEYDLLVDCSAEPSVHAGASGTSRYLLNTNLIGTINCLEAACGRRAALLYLSTSRVYPIAALNSLPHREAPTRFSWDLADGSAPGVSRRGITEAFPLTGARSLYGTSKLAGELLVQEYVHARGLKALINRCGLLAGPWQMGKVDQGVVALWVARHHFQQPLKYIGFGGTGKQVRDVLHVEDLFDLFVQQCQRPDCWDGRVYNVGGGEQSVSLQELTQLCREATGHEVPITPVPETHGVDIRIYITDSTAVETEFGWRARRGVQQVVHDIHAWLCERPDEARRIFLQ
jgi:CDP-paratose 2-epimerase